MAETENNVVTNGNHVDSDDEDLSKMRPVDIDQDVREMERRKRVNYNKNQFMLIIKNHPNSSSFVIINSLFNCFIFG